MLPSFFIPDEFAASVLGSADDGLMSELLHDLWTKAVGTPGYSKREWQALEIVLLRMREEIRNSRGGRP